MARARLRTVVQNSAGARVAGASIDVYETGTTTPIAQTMYADKTGGTTVSNPLTTDARGQAVFYLDLPKDVDLRVVGAGLTTYTVEDEGVEPAAGDIVTSGTLKTSIEALSAVALAAPVVTGGSTSGTTHTSPTITGGTATGTSVIDAAISEARITRPMYGSGLIFTPEYFYRQSTGSAPSTITPGTTDETTYIQAAIDAAKTAVGGIVEFEPRSYKYSKLNASSSSASGGGAAVVHLRGGRAQMTTGPTKWGTHLVPNVAAGNGETAAARCLLDITGNTYVTIENIQFGYSGDDYGSGTTGGDATNLKPAACIMAAGASGWESTALFMQNVLIDGYFTSGAIVVNGASFNEFHNVQAYNRASLGNTPSGTEGGGHALILAGHNFINADFRSFVATAKRRVAYSANATVNTVTDYNATGNNVFYNCQFWTQAGGAFTSNHSAVRLSDAVGATFIGGAIGTRSTSSGPCVEILDDITIGNSPLNTQGITFRDVVFANGTHAVKLSSAHSIHGLTLDTPLLETIQTALVGAIDNASARFVSMTIKSPMVVTGSAPALVNLANTQNSTDRILWSYLDCRGLNLTTVGGIDAATTLIKPGTTTFGGSGNANKAMTGSGTGWSFQSDVLTTTGDILAASAANTPTRIAAGAANTVLRGQGSGVLPSFGALVAADLPTITQNGQAALSGTTTSSSYADATGSVTLTTTGGSVLVMVSGTYTNDNASQDNYFAVGVDGSSDNEIMSANNPASSTRQGFSGLYLHTPSAGSHTYKLRIKRASAGTLTVVSGTIAAIELKK